MGISLKISITILLLFYCHNLLHAQLKKQAPVKTAAPDSTLKSTNKGTTYEQQNERIEQYNPLEQRIRNSADLEIDGLIVDETITKIGRDFYDLFHQNWEPPAQAKNFTILIKELPARGTGALIQISVNDELLFEQHMMPRYDIIQEITVYAVALTTEYLENNLLKQQLDADSRRAIEKY